VSRFLTRFFVVAFAATALLSFVTPSGAAANELSSVVAGASDQASANVDVAKPAIDGRIARTDLEIIESAGRNIPDPLTPQRIESFVNETVTTSQAGHLLVTKSMELTTTCTPTSGVLYFLMVDDVPLRNSAVFSRTGIVGQVSGVTTNVVDAGTHTIRVGQVCTLPGATPSGGSVTLVGITSVIVLP
jgi:hypothetical protein